jgi:hypothetical protein
MPEIHDMVLRNARRLDDVERELEKARHDFEPLFIRKIRAMGKISERSLRATNAIELLHEGFKRRIRPFRVGGDW